MEQRPAFLAGRWYPDDAEACRAALDRHCAEPTPDATEIGGLIGPHAGWAFSGDPAGRAYRALGDAHPDAQLVVVFGSHRGPSGPNTVFRGDAWDTPLGPLDNDRALASALADALALEEEPVRPLRPDNGVELHLPFVKHRWPNARLLMLGVAASGVALEIGREVGRRVQGRDAVVVGSTDLTHYGPNYRFTPRGTGDEAVRWVREENDAGFLDALLRDEPAEALTHAQENGSACCPGAAAAAFEAVRAIRGRVHPRLLSHTLSYDVRPDDSFVGYAGMVM